MFFVFLLSCSDDNYLFNTNIWSTCVYPEGVVAFNVVLFSLVLFASGISLILCTIQVLNGLFGCLCGTCRDKNWKLFQFAG
ncbi:hypothetical protein AB205_0194110 [Aquarana catesbeiana]|uniref:Uncharacterized protein n=1 Tax=Aquarana catesbeiana TaxID=8400 RepID=A0A2G9S9V8_AQUCT|nr:hypothetical protein AB205_0194110 [Aquarana catesbeiana]